MYVFAIGLGVRIVEYGMNTNDGTDDIVPHDGRLCDLWQCVDCKGDACVCCCIPIISDAVGKVWLVTDSLAQPASWPFSQSILPEKSSGDRWWKSRVRRIFDT